MKVAVIGGGLGGLAAACVLGARGHKVTLYDKNGWLGGKAAVLEEGGFRFDMGPTILTVPRVLERIFAEAGYKLADRLPLIRLDPQWRCFFDEGGRLDLIEDVDAMAAAMDRFAPGKGVDEGYRRFLDLAQHLHDVSERFFFWKPVEDMFDTFDLKANLSPSTLRDVLSLRMGSTVAGTIRARVKDGRLAQMLDHFTQYVGSNPYGSPAVLCAIAHMQVAEGVWYPVGGTRAVATALAKLAAEQGCDLRTGEEVTGLDVEGGAVRAVRTARGAEPVDAVVSNMDALRTYRELVGGAAGKAYDRKGFEPACSGVVLYLGLSRRYEHLAHHDWSRMFPANRQAILDKLKRTAGMEDIEERIVVERHLTPQDIHDRYKVLNGAIYGLASHGTFTGAFKPGNRSRHVKGLYLAGGAAHPGPGMPMVMMSGWIAADTLDQDARRVPLRKAS